MLDPDVVLDAVVSALRDIPLLITSLGSVDYITGHHYSYGSDRSLQRAVGAMETGSILLAYLDYLAGDFGNNGMEVWKHRIQMFIQPRNDGDTPPHIWWLAINAPITSTGKSLRYSNLLGHALTLMDIPSLTLQQSVDESDLFTSVLVWPEYGDESYL